MPTNNCLENTVENLSVDIICQIDIIVSAYSSITIYTVCSRQVCYCEIFVVELETVYKRKLKLMS